MSQVIFQKSLPKRLDSNVFKEFNYCEISNARENNTGILLEDGCFEFSFILEDDIKMRMGDSSSFPLSKAFLIGKPLAPFQLIIPEKLTLFTLKIQPWASYHYTTAKSFNYVDLHQIFGNQTSALHSKIFSKKALDGKIDILEDFLLLNSTPNSSEYTLSKQICERIYQSNGQIKVKELMDLSPYSRQKTNALFQQQTKSSVKEFSILVRIRALADYAAKHPNQSLTDITYRFGYFDQSHFIKDMQRAAGVSPKTFFQSRNLFSSQLDLME